MEFQKMMINGEIPALFPIDFCKGCKEKVLLISHGLCSACFNKEIEEGKRGRTLPKQFVRTYNW